MNEIPIASGSPTIDACFNLCVDFLLWLADLLGMSYNAVNIWIFCVLWPLFTVLLILVVVSQHRKIRCLKKEQRALMKEWKKGMHGR